MASILSGKKGILIPLALGLLAILLTFQYIRQRERALMLRGQAVPVLVAKKDIPRLTRIDEGLVVLKLVPKEFKQPGALDTVKDAMGQVTTAPILKGEQVLGTKLVPPGVDTGLAIKVPKGMRAVTVATSPVSGVAGLIKPGNYVDVLGTFEFGDGKKSDQKAYTVFQNVLVLAVNQDLGPESQVTRALTMAQRRSKRGGGGGLQAALGALRPRGGTVTLALTPEQAQGLVLCQQTGRITLTLRSLFGASQVKAMPPASLQSVLGIQEKVIFQPRPWHEIRGTQTR